MNPRRRTLWIVPLALCGLALLPVSARAQQGGGPTERDRAAAPEAPASGERRSADAPSSERRPTAETPTSGDRRPSADGERAPVRVRSTVDVIGPDERVEDVLRRIRENRRTRHAGGEGASEPAGPRGPTSPGEPAARPDRPSEGEAARRPARADERRAGPPEGRRPRAERPDAPASGPEDRRVRDHTPAGGPAGGIPSQGRPDRSSLPSGPGRP